MDIKNLVQSNIGKNRIIDEQNQINISDEEDTDDLLSFKSFLSSTENVIEDHSGEDTDDENYRKMESSSLKHHIADVSTILLNVLLRKDHVPTFSQEQKLRILRTINERPEVFEKLSESIDECIGKRSMEDVSSVQKFNIKCFHVPNIVLLVAGTDMISSIQYQYQYQSPEPIMVWCIAGAILDEFTRDYKTKERQNILTTLKMSIALLNIRQPKEYKQQVKPVKKNCFSFFSYYSCVPRK